MCERDMETTKLRTLLIEIELERKRHDGMMAHFQEAVRALLVGESSGAVGTEWTHPTSGKKRIVEYHPLPGRKKSGAVERGGKKIRGSSQADPMDRFRMEGYPGSLGDLRRNSIPILE